MWYLYVVARRMEGLRCDVHLKVGHDSEKEGSRACIKSPLGLYESKDACDFLLARLLLDAM